VLCVCEPMFVFTLTWKGGDSVLAQQPPVSASGPVSFEKGWEKLSINIHPKKRESHNTNSAVIGGSVVRRMEGEN
jgi:hypothetical protein